MRTVLSSNMNKALALIIVALFCLPALAQRPRPRPSRPAPPPAETPQPTPEPTPTPVDPEAERLKLDAAAATESAKDRIDAIKAFLAEFPESIHAGRAREQLVIARAILADEHLRVNEFAESIKLFETAVAEMPVPVPDRLFREVISKFPANLFFSGQRAAGVNLARSIEKKTANSPAQLLGLASFYLSTENGDEAKRLADAALAIDPSLAAAYQLLGLAHRLNFDLDASAKAYEKAFEIDGSAASRRSLAELLRALGRSDESVEIYRILVAADPEDTAAQNGLVLSLFAAGKKAEAEKGLATALDKDPQNLSLLAGAAYFYAAAGNGDKAVEYANKAIAIQPRYVWGHIALGRGLMLQKDPVAAEKALVAAREHGNFPTLDFEIASARMMAGFFREAAEGLENAFYLKDGKIGVKLGNRVEREGTTFQEAISAERRASIFIPNAADDIVVSDKLRILFAFSKELSAAEPDAEAASFLAGRFVEGTDNMKIHRQLYAASELLRKNVAVSAASDYIKASIGNADSGLLVASPGAAVMASELYDSRTLAFSRNEMIVVPEVPRQILSSILRGRIEELSGWALFQQKDYPAAIIRLRRSVGVLPVDSAWWRGSMWRLGAALEANGDEKEALDSYIKSYKGDRPNLLKYTLVASLYQKVNGNMDGLEEKIGPERVMSVAASDKPMAENERPSEEPSQPSAETVSAAIPETEQKKPEQAETQPVAKIETPEPTKAEQEIKPLPEKPSQETVPVTPVKEDKADSEVKTEPSVPKEEKAAENKPSDIEKTEAAKEEENNKVPETDVKDVKNETPAQESPSEAPPGPQNLLRQPIKPLPVQESEKAPVETLTEKAQLTKLFEDIIITVPAPGKKPVTERPEPVSDGSTRSRVIRGKDIVSDQACSVVSDLDALSIPNSTGSLGIILTFSGTSEIGEIKAASDSPENVSVDQQPQITENSRNRYFLIRSISLATGTFIVNIESACGKKEIVVKVN